MENKQDSARQLQKPLRSLFLDPNNFRLVHEPEYINVPEEQIMDKNVQLRTLRLVTGDKNQHISDLLESFKENGFLPVDQIQVREIESNKFLVIEGNRRISALKVLKSQYDEKGIDLGRLNPKFLSNVPVVLYENGDELHHMTLMALKHISGNKKWGEWNQALLLKKLHNSYELTENQICSRIGISKYELRRSMRALSLIDQYKASDFGDYFSEGMFAIFRELARNARIKEWIGWNDQNYTATNDTKKDLLFSWLSRVPVENEDADGDIAFGEQYLEPAITKRDDIRLLGEMLEDSRAMSALETTRDINAAYRSSDILFQERQDAAIKAVGSEIKSLSHMVIKNDLIPDLEDSFGRLKSILERSKSLSNNEQPSIQHAVFHDRIDSHFKEIKISSYKQIQALSLSKISRINIIAGLNNSGKTTLLEAIYLLCHQNNPAGLIETIRRRGKLSKERLRTSWFINQIPNSIYISGIFDNLNSDISITSNEEESGGFDKTNYLKSVELNSQYNDFKQETLIRFFEGRDRETTTASMKQLCATVFSSPFFLNEPHRYTSFYHKSISSKSLPKILDFIKKHVVSTINDIRLVDDMQRFLVDDSAYDSAMDLTSYGEGLQRIFFTSLLFASAQNGVVLIDEFENAIHTKMIADFAGFVDELSSIFNVQVFITSHSKECIDAFVENIKDAESLSAAALVLEDKKIVVREFSGVKFKKLLAAGDVDLRKAC